MIQVEKTEFTDLWVLKTERFGDLRGFFSEVFNATEYQALGLPSQFANISISHSAPNVLRGLHYQLAPAQGKIVSVVAGRIFDVVVDLRKNSPTFKKWLSFNLSSDTPKHLWIPPGFAHGFCNTENTPATVLYFIDQPYSPGSERGIRYDDTTLQIPWPLSHPIVSQRDQSFSTISSSEFLSFGA